MADIWIGLDVGTTIVKAAAYLSSGQRIAVADAPSPVARPQPGWVEQDMTEVWRKAADCLRRLTGSIQELGYGPGDIASLGVCAQGDGLWMLGQSRRPIGPAMLWNDTRASELVSSATADDRNRHVARACHTANWPGTAGSLFKWVSEHDPDRAAACRHILFCADWIGLNLTGEIGLDFSNGSIPFLDFGTRAWSPEALTAFGLQGSAARLPDPRRTDTILGRVTAEAARATGLPAGLPVATGTLDLSAMIVGHAMHEPGDTMMVLGTTAVLIVLTDGVTRSDAVVGATALHPTVDLTIRILAPTTGAATFDWFTGLHPLSLGGETVEQVAEKLNAIVQDVPPGSNGVLFQPYLSGERAPFVAPDARGAFHGLTPETTKAEMGRAVMEGVAFSLCHCLQAESANVRPPIRLTGGGSRNDVWCGILADVLGEPISVSAAADHGLWGAACIGASATGAGDACDLARRDEGARFYRPDPARHAVYERIFARYLAVSAASPAIWAALNEG